MDGWEGETGGATHRGKENVQSTTERKNVYNKDSTGRAVVFSFIPCFSRAWCNTTCRRVAVWKARKVSIAAFFERARQKKGAQKYEFRVAFPPPDPFPLPLLGNTRHTQHTRTHPSAPTAARRPDPWHGVRVAKASDHPLLCPSGSPVAHPSLPLLEQREGAQGIARGGGKGGGGSRSVATTTAPGHMVLPWPCTRLWDGEPMLCMPPALLHASSLPIPHPRASDHVPFPHPRPPQPTPPIHHRSKGASHRAGERPFFFPLVWRPRGHPDPGVRIGGGNPRSPRPPRHPQPHRHPFILEA